MIFRIERTDNADNVVKETKQRTRDEAANVYSIDAYYVISYTFGGKHESGTDSSYGRLFSVRKEDVRYAQDSKIRNKVPHNR